MYRKKAGGGIRRYVFPDPIHIAKMQAQAYRIKRRAVEGAERCTETMALVITGRSMKARDASEGVVARYEVGIIRNSTKRWFLHATSCSAR